jgi:hypothetical protein
MCCPSSDPTSPCKCLAPVHLRCDKLVSILFTLVADMLQKGFEWTLRRGKPVNKASLRYRLVTVQDLPVDVLLASCSPLI